MGGVVGGGREAFHMPEFDFGVDCLKNCISFDEEFLQDIHTEIVALVCCGVQETKDGENKKEGKSAGFPSFLFRILIV